jgi:hypothetical protein
MALHLADYYKGDRLENARKAINCVLNSAWISGGLDYDNAFTASVVFRAVSLFSRSLKTLSFQHSYKKKIGRRSRTVILPLREVVRTHLQTLRQHGGLCVQGYPRSACLTYWFLQALVHFRDRRLTRDLGAVADWAEEQVTRQMAYVQQKDTARMDTTQLAFSVAILNILRLQRIGATGGKTHSRSDTESLGTKTLDVAVTLVLRDQEQNGLWRKYAPIFHYPKSGADYCFAFELLEMMLESLPDLPAMQSELAIEVFERSITWATENRIKTGTEQPDGWNSGTSDTKRRGSAESWATASVHMFLHRLNSFLSKLIRKNILDRYGADNINETRNSDPWNRLLDSPLSIGGNTTSLRKEVESSIIEPIEIHDYSLPPRYEGRISALLFGPPGTSKTMTVKAIAFRLGWPFIEITPSDFIREGPELIEGRAIQIFEDLYDLDKAVVLFDEMDELLKERLNAPEMISRFLTTSMLPKFQKLYNARKALFFVATNHRETFDVAIVRPSRFDLALHVAPPSTRDKIAKLTQFTILKSVKAGHLKVLKALMRKQAKHLDYFLFDEFHLLLETFFQNKNPNSVLTKAYANLARDFGTLVHDWHARKIILHTDEIEGKKNTYLDEYKIDKTRSTRQ